MENKRIKVRSAESMMDHGRKLGENLQEGDIVVLTGDLAAGKTVFAKGIGTGLGLDEEGITSPAYDLVHEYRDGRLPLYHLDFYRLEELSHSDAHWIEEYLFGDGIAVIEWGEKFIEKLASEYLEIIIYISDQETREFLYVPHGERYRNIVLEVSS